MDERHSTLFFSDGRKTIDFILVYKSSTLTEENLLKLENFLDNLLRTGLDLEVDSFSADRDTAFVKIHASNYTIVHYSDICDIDLAYRNLNYRPSIRPTFRFMATPLTLPNPQDPVYIRAPESVSGNLPKDVTSAEKILVVYEMLSRTKFGPRHADFGIQKLLKDKVFIDAYPIHEGPHTWTEEGPLTDRQLLSKYWGAPGCWYKEQPLNLIEKYYGAEVAFYFAWLGYYVKMLIPITIISILCILYGLCTLHSDINRRSEEICNSDLIMCPRCHYKRCKFEKLANSCVQSYLSYVFDNPASITFAIIISFWSTIFMELWQRRECILQLQWNLTALEYDTSMRPEYVENAVYERYSPITGVKEPYTPKSVTVARYAISIVSAVLMLIVMLLATVGVMVYRLTINLMIAKESEGQVIDKSGHLLASLTGSLISAIFIVVFKMIYRKIAMKLTKLENHRTQHEFDNGYIYKTYALAFTNNYSAVFYIALFKGRFFTHPGDLTLWTNVGGLGSDICSPTGCLIDLSVQLVTIMVVKLFIHNYAQIIIPKFLEVFRRERNRVTRSELPYYEIDYLMAPTDRYFLINEYMDMVIQYGFVVFFVAAFPLLPLFALLNNFAEIRVDSHNVTRSLRRPIPTKVSGLGAWFGILQAVTYVGVVTNAFVIAFTSDFVPRQIYRHYNDYHLRGYTNSTISAFAVKDFETLEQEEAHDIDICYYPGHRYPPDHAMKYQHTTSFWYILAMRFLTVVVFEHVVIILKGILAYVIPDVPASVAEQIAYKERENKEMRMKVLNDSYMEERRKAGFSSIVEPMILNKFVFVNFLVQHFIKIYFIMGCGVLFM